MKFILRFLGIISIIAVVAAIFTILGRSHGHTTPVTGPTPSPNTPSQIWELTEEDKGQVARVAIKPFTYSGDFIETGDDSPGWWILGTQGESVIHLQVDGNIVHDSPNDRWSFVTMGGVGGGYDTKASGGGTSVGNYPDAKSASGTITLTTTSPLGTVSGTVKWTTKRVK